jgi:predicted alpha/beta superfamily hydrolase
VRISSKRLLPICVATMVFCLLPLAVRSQGDARHDPVSLRGTEVRRLRSSFIDEEFKLHVYLPSGYTDSTKTFPVVYLTDSDAYFGYVRSLVGNLRYGNRIPELVVVGVAYEEDVRSYMLKRERDLLPAEVPEHAGSGQAERFLAFMREELVPFMESEYRVDSEDRTILGMSGGATFALYVLFTSPALFDRYVIVSPYLVHGQEVVLDLERAYARQHESLPARVYTAMGELEPLYARTPWETLVQRIRERSYEGLELEQEVLKGLCHMDVVFSAYVNGMKATFSDPSRGLAAVPANYGACVGVYALEAEGIRFTVRHENDRLYISRSGEYWDELVPATETKFGVDANADVQFSFMADGNGAVLRMIVHQFGMERPFEKLD